MVLMAVIKPAHTFNFLNYLFKGAKKNKNLPHGYFLLPDLGFCLALAAGGY